MVNRVTTATTTLAAQRNLQSAAARLATATQNAHELKKVARVSDDPAAAAQAMAVRAQQAATSQYGRNIDDGTNWLASADSALADATSLLQRAADVTKQGANDSLSQPARDALAGELEGLRTDLLRQANTQYLGRSIFAGTSDAGAAFRDADPPAFTGVPGSTVQRRIGPADTVRVDADGAAIFGDGADSAFALLKNVADALRRGENTSGYTAATEAALGKVIDGRAEVGTRHAELLRAQTANGNTVVELENQRSSIEDLDLDKAILDWQGQQLAYQTSLGVVAKVLQPTLMDFLR